VSTWWKSPPIDQAIQEACFADGARYVDIGGLYPNPINRASTERRFSDPHVGIHPGDQGMRGIAGVLAAALTSSARVSP
jgi:hypothetical protein